MDYLRQTVDSNLLREVFDLPVSLQNRRVEVIILPAFTEATAKSKKSNESAFGCLNKYANEELIPKEKDAWQRAMVEKHEDS